MTRTLVNVINIEIFYALDWNLSFCWVQWSEFLNRGRLPMSPRSLWRPRWSGYSRWGSEIIRMHRDSDQADTIINCSPTIGHKTSFHGKSIFLDNIIPRRSEKYSWIFFTAITEILSCDWLSLTCQSFPAGPLSHWFRYKLKLVEGWHRRGRWRNVQYEHESLSL